MLIDGMRCEPHHVTDFMADQVEAVEYYPGGSDFSGNIAARHCRGVTFIIWLRHDKRSP
jgi:hypothetical protein